MGAIELFAWLKCAGLILVLHVVEKVLWYIAYSKSDEGTVAVAFTVDSWGICGDRCEGVGEEQYGGEEGGGCGGEHCDV